MDDMIDPVEASVDDLIQWLREWRSRDQTSPLSKWLQGQNLRPARLVDIVCIDLMQRRRSGSAVTVEDYVADFPALSGTAEQLDLIDADLCVAQELGIAVNVEDYVTRFPGLAPQIRELVQLDVGAKSGPSHGIKDHRTLQGSDTGDFQSNQSSDTSHSGKGEERATCDQITVETGDSYTVLAESGEFSVEIACREREPAGEKAWPEHPIEVPDWFVGGDCIASGPGRWLIRGRDSIRGTPLALKVTELPAQLTTQQSNLILDACELTSKVRHPAWVLPSIAAIQERHLGVIRPWLFARPWQSQIATLDPCDQMRLLATVAFTLASAHKTGATHGGIHVENLMVDHEGQVLVLDAASSHVGLAKWLTTSTCVEGEIASLQARIRLDVQDLIKLVAAASVEWGSTRAADVMGDLQPLARVDTEEAAEVGYLIGQRLVARADQAAENRTGARPAWRIRLAQWLTKEER